jgi:hypothetical protein
LTREEFAAIAGAAKKADRAVEKPIAEAETSAANAPDATSAPPPGPTAKPLENLTPPENSQTWRRGGPTLSEAALADPRNKRVLA